VTRKSKVLFVCYTIGLVLTLAVSLSSMVSIQTALKSGTFANTINLSNSASVYNSQTRLRFTLSTNASSMGATQAITIRVTEQNTLLVPNAVATADNWLVTGLTIGPCGTLGRPVGFAIYQGHYSQNNLQAADQLTLYQPGAYFCPEISLVTGAYTFAPASDAVSINTSCITGSCYSIRINPEGTFTGYWTSGLRPFPPGSYTVVGGDEWDDLLVLHLVVS
jgi:hypothetical protein